VFATRDGVRLFWTEQGRGEPLLLIMGLGATHEFWGRFPAACAPRYRTLLFDNRGAGQSDVPPGPYPIAEMAADAAAVLDAAGVEAAHVFGASMGGMIAQELALTFPSRVRSLVLGCTSCGGRDAVPARREVLLALDARATMPREQAAWTIAPFIFDAATPRERIEEAMATRLGATVSAEGYFAQLQGIRSWSGTRARLGSLTAPTLVVHGEHDDLVPPENARILASAIPGSTLVMLPDASHVFLTDQPERATDAILSFLDASAVTGPGAGIR